MTSPLVRPDPPVPSWPPAWEAMGVHPRPRRSPWREYARPALFFCLTAASVYLTGGWLLMVGVLSILIAHEMGHYVACRYYGVDATLPYFIPFPLSIAGTLGAFIRIRAPFPNRRALFDIGIAGPLAGFLVCVPVLVLGTLQATVISTPSPGSKDFISFGDPLLIQWAYSWLRGEPPAGTTFLMGPLALASWFGLFLTALNLIPIGQLDGGHVTYALFREGALKLSRFGWWVCVALIYLSPNWILWAVLLRVLGRRHPPTLDDDAPLGSGRVVIAVVGLLVFAVCFVPSPIAGSWQMLRELFGELTSR